MKFSISLFKTPTGILNRLCLVFLNFFFFSKLPNPSRSANRIHSGGNGDPDKTKINWVWGGRNSYMTWYDKISDSAPNEVGYLS